ncbi:alpha/beta hydrolase [Streptomyces sp. NPDC051940]|uniref:alpha/beta hydrolase n=1 Tax=Streptomyces sp. NPDC051940 TaxID=3155675 RepID=UPI0034499C37
MRFTRTLLRVSLNSLSTVAPRLAGRGVFWLFRHPLTRMKVTPVEQRLLDAACHGSVSVRGKNVVTYAWGDGERPVLVLHGWQSRASHLAAFITALRERGYTPVTFDAPGHGASEGRAATLLDYREVIGRLSREHGPFEAIVAHSLGAAAAFLALRDGAARTGRLVAVSGLSDFDYVLDYFCTDLGLRPRLRAELRDRIERVLFPGEPEVWRRFDAADSPEEITARMLLIHDERDRYIRIEQSHKTAAAYGEQARLHVTSGLGHRRILGDPEVVKLTMEHVTAPADVTLRG